MEQKRKKIPHSTVVRELSKRTNVSENVVKLVMNDYANFITEQLLEGNEVEFFKICVFTFRRFNLRNLISFGNKKHKYTYSPYVRFSALLREKIRKHYLV